jgi:hypothetical protein
MVFYVFVMANLATFSQGNLTAGCFAGFCMILPIYVEHPLGLVLQLRVEDALALPRFVRSFGAEHRSESPGSSHSNRWLGFRFWILVTRRPNSRSQGKEAGVG